MSQTNAEAQLVRLVADIRRANRRRQLMRAAVTGLLWGTIVASLAVLASRLGWLPLMPAIASATCIVLLPAFTVIAALLRQPATMSLLLAMEHRLGLKQQLSSAWEWHLQAPDTPVTLRLAERVAKLRLTQRISAVWPATLPEATRWLPGGVALLALCWTLSLSSLHSGSLPTTADSRAAGAVQNALQQASPEQWGLLPPPASRRPARRPEGDESNRMASSSQSATRRQSLARLGHGNETLEASRRVALREGEQVDVGPVRQQRTVQGMAARAGATMQRLLALARSGAMDESQISEQDRQTLQSLGIDARDLQDALRESAAGDQRAIERLLEQAAARLSESREARTLAEQRQQGQRRSRRSSERTGESAGRRARSGTTPGAGLAGAGGADANDDPVDAGMFDEAEGAAGEASNAFSDDAPGARGGGGAGTGANPNANSLAEASARSATVVMQATGTPREGIVYRSTGLTLPNANEAQRAPASTASADFDFQAEQTFARSDVAPHQRALVRRYFLLLEQRLNAPAPASERESTQ